MKEAACCSGSENSTPCVLPATGQSCTCAPSSKPEPLSPILVSRNRPPHDSSPSAEPTLWKPLRSGLLLVVACLTSPCCTPVLVSLGLTLLAGTPLAAFLTHYLGWVYGALTLICIGSLVFALLSLHQRSGRLIFLFKKQK